MSNASNALIPQNFGQVSARFAAVERSDDLSSGIQAGFGLIGYRGKVWSIKYRGEEQQLMRDDGDGPRGSIEVVILKASTSISKIWYEQGYVEGSNAAPDCYSNNGVTPELNSAKRQSAACATCPHNQWGSRVTPAGKQGKACSDSKRLAVAPLADIRNDVYGGPMLLRVPAASLQDMAQYGNKMSQLGYPYFGIGTRISFDPAESYPKFVFGAIRPLSDEEADIVIELQKEGAVDRILAMDDHTATAPAQPAAPDINSAFEQPPQQAPQQAPQQQAPVQQQAAQTAVPVTTAQTPPEQVPEAVREQVAPLQPSPVGTVQQPQQAPQQQAPVTPEVSQPQQQAPAQQPVQQQAAPQTATEAPQQPVKQGGGFGPVASQTPTQAPQQPQQQAPAQQAPAQQAPAQQEAQQQAPAQTQPNADFEAKLDNMLAGLLPSTS